MLRHACRARFDAAALRAQTQRDTRSISVVSARGEGSAGVRNSDKSKYRHADDAR